MNTTLRKIRYNLNPKAQAENKAQRHLRPESYFLEFLNRRQTYIHPYILHTYIHTYNILTYTHPYMHPNRDYNFIFIDTEY